MTAPWPLCDARAMDLLTAVYDSGDWTPESYAEDVGISTGWARTQVARLRANGLLCEQQVWSRTLHLTRRGRYLIQAVDRHSQPGRVLRAIHDGYATRTTIADRLGVRYTTIVYHTRKLASYGLIQRDLSTWPARYSEATDAE